MSGKVNVCLMALAVGLASCSIQQKASPVLQLASKEICVVENSAVRNDFLGSYVRALQSKGFLVRVLAPYSDPRTCPLTSTYVARWSWDFKPYLSDAKIMVYRDGGLAGSAEYNSKSGGFRLDKWIDADAKTVELTNELFPG